MKRLLKWLIGLVILAAAAIGITWAMSVPTQAQRGVWRSETGNMLLEISPIQAKAYRETSVSCLQTIAFPAHMQAIKLLALSNLEIETLPILGKGEYIIYCDFFGIKSYYTKNLSNQYGKNLIIDNTHSFLHPRLGAFSARCCGVLLSLSDC